MVTSDLRNIPGFEGYKADRYGNIYSFWSMGPEAAICSSPQRKMRLQHWPIGYLFVALRVTEKGARITRASGAHRLVCAAFNGKPPTPKHTASHLNGNRTDNRPENLCWETQKQNLARKVEHGTLDVGYRNSRSSLNKEQFDTVCDLLDEGLRPVRIAERLGLDDDLIRRINRGERYAKLKEARYA